MSTMDGNKRKHKRFSSKGFLKIYTSITRGAYTVGLKDISKGGAFIKTEHMPEVGETITYVVVDEWGRERYVGNAKVKWCKRIGLSDNKGFGIEFEKKLVDEIEKELREE